jgi:hypothetical protein
MYHIAKILNRCISPNIKSDEEAIEEYTTILSELDNGTYILIDLIPYETEDSIRNVEILYVKDGKVSE